jgi:predicted dienelactone hydrolase
MKCSPCRPLWAMWRRAAKPALPLLFCLVVASSLLGCIGVLGPEVARPVTLGSESVGVTTITVDDPSRDRKLTVEVWYPATDSTSTQNAAPVVYSMETLGATVARLRSPARAHRDIAPRQGAHPVVVVSHGMGSTRFGNMTLCEILASHGYLVAAPDHIGDLSQDYIFGISAKQRALNTLNRQLDISRVLDSLETRSRTPGDGFYGLVDMSRVAILGHSFGGLTALGMVGARFDAPRLARECQKDDSDRFCQAVPLLGPKPYRYRDSRIKAAVLIAPGGYDLYRADGIAAVDAPTLVVAGMRDEGNKFNEHPKPIYDALTSPHYMLKFEDAGHLTMTDLCELTDSIGFLAKVFGGKKGRDGCGGEAAGFMSTRVTADLIGRATLAFLDRYVNDNPAAESELALALAPDVDKVRPRPKDLAEVNARQTSGAIHR